MGLPLSSGNYLWYLRSEGCAGWWVEHINTRKDGFYYECL